MSRPPLYIGPFPGEFGWGITTWVPIARGWVKAQATPPGEVTVACQSKSQYLYRDFADSFVDIDVYPGTQEDFRGELRHVFSPWPNELQFKPDQWMVQHEFSRIAHAMYTETDIGHPQRKEFVPYGDRGYMPGVDVCVAFRPIKSYQGRMFAEKEWDQVQMRALMLKLKAAGLRTAAIGGKDNHAAGADLDYRGHPLETQCRVLASSRLCVGPSSGPMHLASFCGTPHVTWYGYKDAANLSSAVRYERVWNPFQTKVKFLRDRTQPSASEVFEAVQNILS